MAVLVILSGCQNTTKFPWNTTPVLNQMIVLNWDGGSRLEAQLIGTRLMSRGLDNIVPPALLNNFDVWKVYNKPPINKLSDFPNFKEDVRRRTQFILDKLRPQNLVVINGDLQNIRSATIVWMSYTSYSKPNDGILGLGTVDDCNRFSMDEAVVYGATLNGPIFRDLLHPTYERWVNLFANSAAHETAHTLGFRHNPPILQVPEEDLMRAMHGNTSMDDELEFLVEYMKIPDQQPGMQCNSGTDFSVLRRVTKYRFLGDNAKRIVIKKLNTFGWPYNNKPFEFLIDDKFVAPPIMREIPTRIVTCATED